MAINHYHPVTVGGLELPGNIFLAPIAGYTDAAFRSVCFELGADLCYTEMVSAEALTRSHPKTGMLMDRAENETRFAVQLFGSRPETLAAAAALAAERGPALIDLNCGCPVPKIVRAGAGSALMKDPALIRGIVAAMKAAVGPGGPVVTVKIRSGWDEEGVNYREAADAAVEGARRRSPSREDPRPGLRREGRLGKDRRPRTPSRRAGIRLGRRLGGGRRGAYDRADRLRRRHDSPGRDGRSLHLPRGEGGHGRAPCPRGLGCGAGRRGQEALISRRALPW